MGADMGLCKTTHSRWRSGSVLGPYPAKNKSQVMLRHHLLQRSATQRPVDRNDLAKHFILTPRETFSHICDDHSLESNFTEPAQAPARVSHLPSTSSTSLKAALHSAAPYSTCPAPRSAGAKFRSFSAQRRRKALRLRSLTLKKFHTLPPHPCLLKGGPPL